MRVVIDTDVFVSYLLSQRRAGAWLLMLWNERYFDIVCSDALLAELAEVLERPRIAPRIPVERRLALIRRLRARAIWAPGTLDVTGATSDPGDEMLMSAALETGAKFIVTWDKTLLDQGSYQNVRFVAPDEFIAVVLRTQMG